MIHSLLFTGLTFSGLLLCSGQTTFAQAGPKEAKGVFPGDYPVVHPQFRKWPAPAMDQPVSTVCPAIGWPALKKAGTTYDLRLSPDSSFPENNTLKEDGIPWTVYYPHRSLQNGRWYWQYRVHDGQWSATESFRITPGAEKMFAPPVERFWSAIPAGHPRVLIDEKERDGFAAGVRTSEDASVILHKAKTALSLAIPNEKEGLNTREGNNAEEIRKLELVASEHASNKMYYTIDLFCKAYLITGDEQYAGKAIDWGMALSGWDPNGISHSSDFGEARCMVALALVFDTFHDRLSEAQRMALLKGVRPRADRFYHEWINNIDAKVLSNHVWQYILHYFLQTAIAVYGEVGEAGSWIRYAYELWLTRAPVLGGGDGSWGEGPAYFRINMETLLGIPMLIRQYTGFDFIKANAWYQKNPYWIAYSFPAGSSSDGFGDDVEKLFSPGADYLAYADALSRLTGNRMAAWYAGRIEQVEHLQLAGADMLRWFRMRYLRDRRRPAPMAASELPAAMLFPGNGIADMHSDIADRDKDLMISFRSSPYGSYGHLLADQNTFNILAAGQRLFYMTGHKVAMQDPHRLGWYKATQGHNGILVDGKGQPFNVEAYGYIKKFLDGKDLSYVMGDASRAYSSKAEGQEAGLKVFNRHLLFLHPDILLVYDELEADHPAEWSWLIHSPYRITMDSARNQIRCGGGGSTASVTLFAQQPLRWALSDTFGIPAVNWLGREDEEGNLIEYKNDAWHVKVQPSEKMSRMRFLAVIRVRVGKNEKPAEATELPVAQDSSGTLRIDDWTIHAVLDPAKPALLEAYNKSRHVTFSSMGTALADLIPDAVKGIPVRPSKK